MRECKLCGKDTPELLGPYCARCDKVVGDVKTKVGHDRLIII